MSPVPIWLRTNKENPVPTPQIEGNGKIVLPTPEETLKLRSSKQGQGPGTKNKQLGLDYLLQIILDVSWAESVRKYPFWWADFNAGCGYNHQVGCDGSPVVFMDALMGHNRRKSFNALFCDNDKETCHKMGVRLCDYEYDEEYCSMYFVDKSNSEAIDQFDNLIRNSGEISKLAVGGMYFDPNGPSPDSVPYEQITKFANRHHKIDFIMNVNVSTFRAIRGAKNHGQKGFHGRYPELHDFLNGLGKEYWYARKPYWSGMYYSLVFGTNKNLNRKQQKIMDFYPKGSQQWDLVINQLLPKGAMEKWVD